MTRDDLVFLGVRLYGIYLLVNFAVSIPGIFALMAGDDETLTFVVDRPVRSTIVAVLSYLVRGAAGFLLAFHTERIVNFLNQWRTRPRIPRPAHEQA